LRKATRTRNALGDDFPKKYKLNWKNCFKKSNTLIDTFFFLNTRNYINIPKNMKADKWIHFDNADEIK